MRTGAAEAIAHLRLLLSMYETIKRHCGVHLRVSQRRVCDCFLEPLKERFAMLLHCDVLPGGPRILGTGSRKLYDSFNSAVFYLEGGYVHKAVQKPSRRLRTSPDMLGDEKETIQRKGEIELCGKTKERMAERKKC